MEFEQLRIDSSVSLTPNESADRRIVYDDKKLSRVCLKEMQYISAATVVSRLFGSADFETLRLTASDLMATKPSDSA
jgi:hypothetical protein